MGEGGLGGLGVFFFRGPRVLGSGATRLGGLTGEWASATVGTWGAGGAIGLGAWELGSPKGVGGLGRLDDKVA
jgi:hypothetical protein